MRIGELAQRAQVTVKAVRYYERIGLLTPLREENGYRSFTEDDLRAVREIRELARLGVSPLRAGPFVECLDLGHEHGDECVSSLSVYRDTIAELDSMIDALTSRREALIRRLKSRAGRTFTKEKHVADYTQLPEGLPIPEHDGAARHLPGLRTPSLMLPTSDGGTIHLGELGRGRTILYLYPLTGRPGVDLPEGWDSIPGARGCSTEACDFRDHFADLQAAGAARVFGMSSQDPEYQAEVVARLQLPFPMVSDERFALADASDLTQIVVLVVVVLAAGTINSDVRSGVAALILVKPATRAGYVLSHALVLIAFVALAAHLGAVVSWLVTTAVFGPAPLGPVLGATAVWVVLAAVLISAALLASAAFDGAAGIGIGVFFLLALLGVVPQLADYTPAGLIPATNAIATGIQDPDQTLWWPVASGVLCAGALLAVAVLVFRRRELR